MSVNAITSSLYLKALAEGIKPNQVGEIYRTFYGRSSMVEQIISPNGSYEMSIKQGGELAKTVRRIAVGEKGSILDTWDYIKNEGKYFQKTFVSPKSFRQGVFKKSDFESVNTFAEVNFHQKGYNPIFLQKLDFSKRLGESAPVEKLNSMFIKMVNNVHFL